MRDKATKKNVEAIMVAAEWGDNKDVSELIPNMLPTVFVISLSHLRKLSIAHTHNADEETNNNQEN